MIDAAEATWVRSLLRRNMRSTVFLTVFAAVAAAASMTAWEYARRAHTVVDRRIEQYRPAEGGLNSCPPGVDPGSEISKCFGIESNREAFGSLMESTHVEAASFVISTDLRIATSPDGEDWRLFATSEVVATGPVGVANVLEGRGVDPAAIDELMISETTATTLDLGPGSTVWVRTCEFSFVGSATTCGDRRPMSVVGITRTDRDLVPVRSSPPGLDSAEYDFGAITSRAWFEQIGYEYPAFSLSTFRLAEGATLDDVRIDVETRLADGWSVLVVGGEGDTIYTGLRQATQLQGRALLAIAGIIAIAGAVFVGQGLVRQTRRELTDHSIATALGMADRQIVRIATLRGTVIALPAAVLAVGIAVGTSPLGPPGLAGAAEVDRGLVVDGFVLVIGAAVVAAAILALMAVTAWRVVRSARRRSLRVAPPSVAALMSPAASAGFVLGRSSRAAGSARAAVLGTAAAVIGVVVAAVVVDSLRLVEREPRRFGVSWDYSVGEIDSLQLADTIAASVEGDPVITDAAFAFSSGPIDLPSAPALWVVSFLSLKGDAVGPVIVSGRAPVEPDEVAVGPATLASLGLGVGDTIELPVLLRGGDDEGDPGEASDLSEESPFAGIDREVDLDPDGDGMLGPFTIVGEAVVSDDAREVGPGKGMVMTEAARQQLDPAVSPILLVRTDPAIAALDTARHLDQTYSAVAIPAPQADIGNLLLLIDTPWVIAALVAVLAMAALAHALITLVRRSRREVGVLRALGFTRGQVVRAVCWQATGLSVLAIVIGVPIGVAVGRWGWELIAEQVGIASPAVVRWIAPLGCALIVLLVANSIAAVTGARAGRRDLIDSLRAE